MNELLELLKSMKDNGVWAVIPLTNIIEECLVEAKHGDNYAVGNILAVSNHIISRYAIAAGTICLNTIDENQFLEFEAILSEFICSRECEKEFNLFCKKAFELISWYIETAPY